MASKDELYELADTMTLQPNAAGGLQQDFQQPRLLPDWQRVQSQTFNFPNTAAFEQVNTIIIPSADLWAKYAYIQIDMSPLVAYSEGDPDPVLTSDLRYAPSSTWFRVCRLLYKNSVVYEMTEAEAVMCELLDNDSDKFNNQGRLTSWDVFNNNNSDNATAGGLFYIDINQIARQWLQHLPPISSFNSQDWQIQIELYPLRQILSGASVILTNPAISPANPILNMKLVLLGLKASGWEVRQGREALQNKGVEFYNLKPFWQRVNMANGSAGNKETTIIFNTVSGNASCLRYMHRNSVYYHNASAVELNNVQFNNLITPFNGVDNYLEIGTREAPNCFFGRPVWPHVINGLYQRTKGNSRMAVSHRDSALPWIAETLDSSISEVSFNESPQAMLNACSVGSVWVDNNFRFSYVMPNTGATEVQQILDVILYTHQRNLITIKDFSTVSSA